MRIEYSWTPPADVKYGFDLNKARQLLQEAGYKEVNGARVDKQGKPIVLRLYALDNVANDQREAKLLVQWFSQLGLKVKYQTLDVGAMLDAIYNYKGDTPAPDYDMFVWWWTRNTFDPSRHLAVFTTGQIGKQNDWQWSNAESTGSSSSRLKRWIPRSGRSSSGACRRSNTKSLH